MTDDTYYDNYYDLFQMDGWKQLTEELTSNRDNVMDIRVVKDNDDLKFRQGQLQVLESILNLPAFLEATREEA